MRNILHCDMNNFYASVPKLKDFLESAREEEALCYCEC